MIQGVSWRFGCSGWMIVTLPPQASRELDRAQEANPATGCPSNLKGEIVSKTGIEPVSRELQSGALTTGVSGCPVLFRPQRMPWRNPARHATGRGDAFNGGHLRLATAALATQKIGKSSRQRPSRGAARCQRTGIGFHRHGCTAVSQRCRARGAYRANRKSDRRTQRLGFRKPSSLGPSRARSREVSRRPAAFARFPTCRGSGPALP